MQGHSKHGSQFYRPDHSSHLGIYVAATGIYFYKFEAFIDLLSVSYISVAFRIHNLGRFQPLFLGIG